MRSVIYIDIYIPVESAVCHVVDHMSERRYIKILPAVEFYGYEIIGPVF